MAGYENDLAYVHDVGFAGFAEQSAPGILSLFTEHRINEGLIVELGCGSGVLTRHLLARGYDVLGIDQSAAMIERAKVRAPGATLRVASFLRAELPTCSAVVAVGEVFNYLFDADNTEHALWRFFSRVHDAPRQGGIFLFDVAGPGRVPGNQSLKTFSVGQDWAILFEAAENTEERVLTRHMTTFRKEEHLYRRSDEVHRLRLHESAVVQEHLERAGFRSRLLAGYGDWKLGPSHYVIFGEKV